MGNHRQSFASEGALFLHLRKPLFQDLLDNDVPSSVAGAILNWFDPREPDYLSRVDAWQRMLCAGAVLDSPPDFLIEFGVVKKTAWATYSILEAPPWKVKLIHLVAKMFYKFRGKPRKETDFGEVKQRFARPSNVQLDSHEVEGIKAALSGLKPPDSWTSIVGRFGPGVTADHIDNVGKWKRRGYYPYAVPKDFYACDEIDFVENHHKLIAGKYGVTRVAEVPKSLKSNRIVSSEPAYWMYAQLGVNDALVAELHKAFPDNISLFSQQKHNRLLRMDGACSIDLSDASDHVSRRLVSLVLPDWKSYLFSVRSTFAQFPDGSIVPLRTFAPMGSGVCFSVLTAVCAGICQYACRRPWHVYGDDIIVHVRDYDYVLSLLTKAGLIVNRSKSCCTLVYRESCGVELFRDTEITPFYFRRDPTQVDGAMMEAMLARLEQTDAPLLHLREALLHLWRAAYGPLALRWNQQYQRLEVRVPVAKLQKSSRLVSGYDGLNRWFSVKAEEQQVVFRTTDFGLTLAFRAAADYSRLVAGLGTQDAIARPAKDDLRPNKPR